MVELILIVLAVLSLPALLIVLAAVVDASEGE